LPHKTYNDYLFIWWTLYHSAQELVKVLRKVLIICL